jgi:hypothetical protein
LLVLLDGTCAGVVEVDEGDEYIVVYELVASHGDHEALVDAGAVVGVVQFAVVLVGEAPELRPEVDVIVNSQPVESDARAVAANRERSMSRNFIMSSLSSLQLLSTCA